jgi:hypothetical protein
MSEGIMSSKGSQSRGPCREKFISGLRLITLPGGSKAGLMGLDQIFEDLYKGEVKPDDETAAEIVRRLRKQNYITPSIRHLYEEALLKEYEKYFYRKIESFARGFNKAGKTATKSKSFWKSLLRKIQGDGVRHWGVIRMK